MGFHLDVDQLDHDVEDDISGVKHYCEWVDQA